jgi:hypothetical protein
MSVCGPRALALVILSLAAACDSSGPSGSEKVFQDQGKVCAFPPGTDPAPFGGPNEPASFPADRALLITVMAPTCLSSSCSKDRKAECSTEVKGNVIVVTSKLSFRQEGTTCTADCGALVARCMTPPLPAGSYLVQHGTQNFGLTVPTTTIPPCAGQAP